MEGQAHPLGVDLRKASCTARRHLPVLRTVIGHMSGKTHPVAVDDAESVGYEVSQQTLGDVI